jgi:hypothetical protein
MYLKLVRNARVKWVDLQSSYSLVIPIINFYEEHIFLCNANRKYNMAQKKFLLCGTLSSLLYIAMNIFVPMLYKDYNSASQTVSELSAVGAPTRTLWVLLGTVYTFLITAFGWSILKSSGENRYLRIVGILIFIYGIISFIWPFAPMHQREALAAGGKTISDTMHLVLAMVTVLLMTSAMGFGQQHLENRSVFIPLLRY